MKNVTSLTFAVPSTILLIRAQKLDGLSPSFEAIRLSKLRTNTLAELDTKDDLFIHA